MPRIYPSVNWVVALSCLLSTGTLAASIGDLQWVGADIQVGISTVYAAAPVPKTLVVAGFGNCAVQMPEAWQRHLFELNEPAPTGNCDTWQTEQSPNGVGEALYFGSDSLQPDYSDYVPLTQQGLLYGFSTLPGALDKVNRLYQSTALAHEDGATWGFNGDSSLTYSTSTMTLPLYVNLVTSYSRLHSCRDFGGSPVLTVSQTGSSTAYSFSLYLLTLQRDPDYPVGSNKLISTCSHRQFTHSVGASITATWGGFGTTNDTSSAGYAIGVRAEYLLNLLADPAEATIAFQDPDLISALEVQIFLTLAALQADDWVLDLTVDDPYRVSVRRSALANYQVPFTAIYRMLNNGTATSDVATMSAVLRHVVAEAYSNTPDFKTEFVRQWRERYINATGKPWPLPSVQLADPPFSLTLPGPSYVIIETAPPTSAPAQGTPTAAPTVQPTDADPSDDSMLPIILGVCGGVVAIVLIVILVYCLVCKGKGKYERVDRVDKSKN